MTIHVISRHPAVSDWLADRNVFIDSVLPHLDLAQIRPGDVVIGDLPVHQAAEVCWLGARYVHVALDLAPRQRGAELSVQDMDAAGARLEEYWLEKFKGVPEEIASLQDKSIAVSASTLHP